MPCSTVNKNNDSKGHKQKRGAICVTLVSDIKYHITLQGCAQKMLSFTAPSSPGFSGPK